jgi:hypothetical protein
VGCCPGNPSTRRPRTSSLEKKSYSTVCKIGNTSVPKISISRVSNSSLAIQASQEISQEHLRVLPYSCSSRKFATRNQYPSKTTLQLQITPSLRNSLQIRSDCCTCIPSYILASWPLLSIPFVEILGGVKNSSLTC